MLPFNVIRNDVKDTSKAYLALVLSQDLHSLVDLVVLVLFGLGTKVLALLRVGFVLGDAIRRLLEIHLNSNLKL